MEQVSSLLSLPKELRQQIFTYCLPSFTPGETIRYDLCNCGRNCGNSHVVKQHRRLRKHEDEVFERRRSFLIDESWLTLLPLINKQIHLETMHLYRPGILELMLCSHYCRDRYAGIPLSILNPAFRGYTLNISSKHDHVPPGSTIWVGTPFGPQQRVFWATHDHVSCEWVPSSKWRMSMGYYGKTNSGLPKLEE